MEIEKTLFLNGPPSRVWAFLLDPQAMGQCVPGMESIEVLSEDEYIARMKVKISFISARFKLKTRIVERREPHYLRAEGTGEDTSVASSLKQTSEMWLEERDDGTELRIKVKVDVFGRMGTFGLSVMKTKADRMWDEFGVNAAARLAPAGSAGAAPVAPAPVPAPVSTVMAGMTPAPVAGPVGQRIGWWARLFDRRTVQDIRVEVRRGDTTITIQWPVQASQECVAWLRTLV